MLWIFIYVSINCDKTRNMEHSGTFRNIPEQEKKIKIQKKNNNNKLNKNKGKNEKKCVYLYKMKLHCIQ